MTATSSADGPPAAARAITADRYSDGTAFGAPHAHPAVPRAVYPEYRPPGMRGREYLLDVVSAALAPPDPDGDPPIRQLIEGPELVEDVCRDYAVAVLELCAARDEAQAAVLDLERAQDDLADAKRLLLELGRLSSESQLRAAFDRAAISITGLTYSELAAQLDAEMGDVVEPPPTSYARDQRDPDSLETLDTIVVDPEIP